MEALTTPWFLYPSEIMHMGFTEHLLARAVFIKSIKVLDGNEEPRKPGSRIFRKNVLFLKFIGLLTPLWALYPSEIKHIGFTGPLPARAVCTKSIKVLGWQAGAPKSREHDFPKKKTSFFFEFHRTSDTSMGSVSLCNHAFGLHRNFTGQSSVCKFN